MKNLSITNPLNGKTLHIKPDGIRYHKYLFLGLNKTATTAISRLMSANGLKTKHSGLWRINDFDAFCDNPAIKCNRDYESVCHQWPGSIFLLNTRPLNEWLKSRILHPINRFDNDKMNREEKKNLTEILDADVGEDRLTERIIELAKFRNEWHKKILTHFEHPLYKDRLILVNIKQPQWNIFVSTILYLEKHDTPRKNETKSSIDTSLNNKLTRCIDNAFSSLEKIDIFPGQLLCSDLSLTEKALKNHSNNIGIQ